MLKPVLTAVFASGLLAGAASADPLPLDANAAPLNLSPPADFTHADPAPKFTPDRAPTAFTYALPAPGLETRVGFKPSDSRSERTYEVNQATAVGFSQTNASVGASVGLRF